MQIKLGSIILFVKSVDQLKKFYTDIFKFEVIEDLGEEWILLNAGGCTLGLHKIGDQYINNEDSKQENNTKIVFETDTIAELRNSLLIQNVVIGEIKTFENYDYWICDGEDPEGNIFQLMQKK
ncbi:VOC family protein [Pedobacter duraquae]|uniref:Putative enzyme related to lactoylglutathione lyase n=1 Tax=Pedobacter duraquae TaxID=425511 RepID=A0A4R6IRC4_9SPHI|nr:VOC family protein [Pedobacter duraquae]TDO24526.1 putative enzyme related to lactoylglutathione lyase [Pedobacter duraquae]